MTQFPHKIVSVTMAVGPAYEAIARSYRSYRWLPGLVELVVDDQQKGWWARGGMLCPIGTDYGAVPNYRDPRTEFHAVAIGESGESADDVTSFGWYDAAGNLVEEVSDEQALADPLLRTPPDRRAEFAAFLAARKGLDPEHYGREG